MSLEDLNEAIVSSWMGKRVRQMDGIPSLVGREGTVVEVFCDEINHLHCRVEFAGEPFTLPLDFWCPAALLEQL